MSQEVDELRQKFELGSKILNEIGDLPTTEIKRLLKEICGGKISDDVFEKGELGKKWNETTKWEQINLQFYDKIVVDWFGITITPENHKPTVVVRFDKFFHIPEEYTKKETNTDFEFHEKMRDLHLHL